MKAAMKILGSQLLAIGSHMIERACIVALPLLLVTACTVQSADKVPTVSAHDEIARAAAEIDRRIENENRHPFKTFISPSTRDVGYATYYKAAARRIEEVGTRDFPQKDGKKLYGTLILYIPIYQDGSLYLRDGGPKIEKGSGNADLDQAALDIVRKAAPFGAFPSHMLSPSADDVWVMVSGFSFQQVGTAAPHVNVMK